MGGREIAFYCKCIKKHDFITQLNYTTHSAVKSVCLSVGANFMARWHENDLKRVCVWGGGGGQAWNGSQI